MQNPSYIYSPNTVKEFHRDWNLLKSNPHPEHWLAGFISYEAGYLFEERLRPLLPKKRNIPLFWLGVFERAIESEEIFTRQDSSFYPTDFKLGVEYSEYKDNFLKIQSYLEKGDSYQVNYTIPSSFQWEGSGHSLYQYLLSRQRVAYSSYCDTGKHQIISLSPELFFRLDGNRIQAKPMKGTARRSPHLLIDKQIEYALGNSEKNRAENLMITDLIRNDLGKISIPGSVKTSNIFSVETYETVHQMTSTVEAELLPEMDFFCLIENLFPSGSITGAPKIRSMEIIRELESKPRGVYTGTIGYLPPRKLNKPSVWNIAIRTIELEHRTGHLGIGGGIVLDSRPEEEYEECKTKARFLTEKKKLARDFYLFESIYFTGRIFRLLQYHKKRMEESAAYFRIPFSEEDFQYILERTILQSNDTPSRVRIELREDGGFRVSSFPLVELEKGSKTISIAPIPMNSENIFLYHKTSNRIEYDEIYKNRGENYDVLFLNEKEELTESCVHTIFIKIGNVYYTPAWESGLLPGTLRSYCLEKFPRLFQEKVLYRKDLENAERIVLGNSVRGFTECTYLDPYLPQYPEV